MRKTNKIYALYRGDDILIVGTARELADYLGTSVSNIYCIKNRCGLRKTNRSYYVISLDEED